MNTNRNKKSSSFLLFLSIGMNGSLPTGHPVYQGCDNTAANDFKLLS